MGFVEQKVNGKSYKNMETLTKAIEHVGSKFFCRGDNPIRYVVHTFPDGRVTPVFIGQDAVLLAHYGYTVVG